MIIDFDKIKETKLDNFKGGEKYIAAKMFVDNNNKIMFGYIIPGASIGLHTHTESSEIVYILKRKATIIYDNCEEIVTQGQTEQKAPPMWGCSWWPMYQKEMSSFFFEAPR